VNTSTLLIVILLQGLALSLAMTGAWLIQQRTGNSGWIDAVWTFALGTVGVVSVLAPLSEVGGISTRQAAVAAMIALWSARLGGHIVQRSARRTDDPRYAELIRGYGPNARRELLVLLQKQALVSLPLALSMFLAGHAPASWRWQDVLAFAVLGTAILGEAVADGQLREFQRKSKSKGRVCDTGLWRFSRHPNYFFEWMQWLAYPLLAIDATGAYPWGWLALLGPLCMYWLLVYVSGVPPLEEHMLRRYGPAYRDYQLRTSAFFPAPRKL
jgi:steroid 5-alpha reductase family enzyme